MNYRKLIITEKPSVAQQFASVLGVKRTSKLMAI